LVVVGAPSDDVLFGSAGSASVYDLASATPTLLATLTNPNPNADGDFFGLSVAVSGTRVVVGAPYDDTSAIDAGITYVYDFGSPTPTVPVATLNNPSHTTGGSFGWSVVIS